MTEPDRILLAWISRITRRHTGQGEIDDLDNAVAELQAVAHGRRDLLTEHAGVSLGIAEAGLDILAPIYRAQAKLCLAAGANPEKLGPWIEVGRKRAETASAVPCTGVNHSR